MPLSRSTIITVLCLLGFNALAALPPPLKRGTPGKNRGDIIAPLLDEQIAAWCDFNKQIVVTQTNVLCAYVGDKQNTVSSARKLQAPPKLAAKQKSPRAPKDLTPNFYEMSEYSAES